MLAIAFRFPAGGRYHATAWGTHPNEGVPEWPPAPWRLLRALCATARWKHSPSTSGEQPRLRSLIEALAAAPPPRFRLPPATAAHTRHYMPLGDDKTTEILDAFVQPAVDEPLIAMWDVDLPPLLREFLAALLARLSYLGRAESLCEAELLPESADPPPDANAWPIVPGEPPRPDTQTLRLLAPIPPADYASWRARETGSTDKKSSPRRREVAPAPVDLFEALHISTEDWRADGWSQPPGSRWVEYARPNQPFRPSVVSAAPEAPAATTAALPQVARFRIQTPVKESLTECLAFGERVHTALCARSDAAPAFSGRHEGQSIPGHEHTFILPESDERGLLTGLVLYARMGFDTVARDALRSLPGVWSRRGPGIKLLLVGLGTIDEFEDLPQFRPSRVWESHTPFVPVRHIQRSRKGKPRIDPNTGLVRGGPEHDLRRLLAENGYPRPLAIHPVEALALPGRRLRWSTFRRQRRIGNGIGATGHPAFGFRIEFDRAVSGPIALGFGAHFGLGLFLPKDTTDPT